MELQQPITDRSSQSCSQQLASSFCDASPAPQTSSTGPADCREAAEGKLHSPINTWCEEWRISEHISMDGGGRRQCTVGQQAAAGLWHAANTGEPLLCFPPLHHACCNRSLGFWVTLSSGAEASWDCPWVAVTYSVSAISFLVLTEEQPRGLCSSKWVTSTTGELGSVSPCRSSPSSPPPACLCPSSCQLLFQGVCY